MNDIAIHSAIEFGFAAEEETNTEQPTPETTSEMLTDVKHPAPAPPDRLLSKQTKKVEHNNKQQRQLLSQFFFK